MLPDRQSAELGAAARRDDPAAVTQLPLEFVDDTLGFNPEWIVDRIAPRPVLFITTDDDRLVPPQESEAMFARAGEPKKLVVLKGFGHYEVYGGEAFRQVMDETVAWYKRIFRRGDAHLCPSRSLFPGSRSPLLLHRLHEAVHGRAQLVHQLLELLVAGAAVERVA